MSIERDADAVPISLTSLPPPYDAEGDPAVVVTLVLLLVFSVLFLALLVTHLVFGVLPETIVQ